MKAAVAEVLNSWGAEGWEILGEIGVNLGGYMVGHCHDHSRHRRHVEVEAWAKRPKMPDHPYR